MKNLKIVLFSSICDIHEEPEYPSVKLYSKYILFIQTVYKACLFIKNVDSTKLSLNKYILEFVMIFQMFVSVFEEFKWNHEVCRSKCKSFYYLK